MPQINTKEVHSPDYSHQRGAIDEHEPLILPSEWDGQPVTYKHVELMKMGAIQPAHGQPGGILVLVANLAKHKGMMIILDPAEAREIGAAMIEVADQYESGFIGEKLAEARKEAVQ
jgi:hypothetical protein